MSDILSEEYKKGVLQCRSSCKRTFHQSELTRIQTEQLGQQVIQSVCPYCGSSTYGLVDYPVSEYELIFKNNEFYRLYKDQKRQMRIDNGLEDEDEINYYMNGYIIEE